MKKRISILLSLLIICGSQLLKAQATGNAVVDVILSGYSVRAYTTQPVTDQQLELILKCGIKAPSARNGQPWKFTVIRDEATMKEIIKDAVAGNVLIIVSGSETQQVGVNVEFDCGLATHSMFVAAEGLGLGARIYGGPVAAINQKRVAYKIPEGYRPIVVLRIGNKDKSVDAVSAATPRKPFEEVVNYKN
ncbi:MAG: nitroreductase family protein [Bacteroidales bacterium]|nr:nitroreductase family protein [Bacteroidales bacterium]